MRALLFVELPLAYFGLFLWDFFERMSGTRALLPMLKLSMICANLAIVFVSSKSIKMHMYKLDKILFGSVVFMYLYSLVQASIRSSYHCNVSNPVLEIEFECNLHQLQWLHNHSNHYKVK